ncbi:divisome protein SepX/GlpR [Halostreptopolyspora alba]|uniref:Uncharacterized protein n=1 Tax=Halostreptopolyspora alba TaxID=2487137 RepID=A0A3N0E4W9_9ACTN|nr:hypothetical protein EFW17_18135 [Nocardiopsaceae bacterium YIM 96095]
MGSSPLYLAIVVVWLIVLVPMLLRRDTADPVIGPVRRTEQGGVPSEDDEDLDEEAAEFEDLDEEDQADEHDDEFGPAPAPTRRRAPRGGGAGVEAGTARRPDGPAPRGADDDASDTAVFTRSEPVPPPARARVSRARVIARRRRRTSGLVLLLVGTGIAVSLGLGPWWVLAPPAVLLLGHLALLREAAKIDAERRVAEARYRQRLRADAHARRDAEAAREAEVIELMSRRNQVYDQYEDAQLRAAGD